MNNRVDVHDWYQLDFNIKTPKVTLEAISKLMELVLNQGLVEKWFYLFENSTIRVRMHSKIPAELETTINENISSLHLVISTEHGFEGYWESSDSFTDEKVAGTFADIMSSLTSLTITRLKGANFSNYKLVERLSHCIFNNTFGSDTEVFLLLKRLGVDFQGKDNPEQSILDENQKYELGSLPTLSIPSFKMPVK